MFHHSLSNQQNIERWKDAELLPFHDVMRRIFVKFPKSGTAMSVNFPRKTGTLIIKLFFFVELHQRVQKHRQQQWMIKLRYPILGTTVPCRGLVFSYVCDHRTMQRISVFLCL